MSILDQYEEKILWEAQPSGLWQRLLTKLQIGRASCRERV